MIPSKLSPYSTDILGSDGKHYIEGPGVGFGYGGSMYPNMRFSNQDDVQAGVRCSNEAYLQGYRQAQWDIKKALGIT